jgi:undecaprenyl-diphosphatase
MAQSPADKVSTVERRLILDAFRNLVLAGIALAIFGWLAGRLLAAGTVHFDLSVRNWIHSHASPISTEWMLRITTLGNWYVILPAAAVLLIYLQVKGRPQEARLLAVTMAGALLLDAILKLTFRRARPEPFFDLLTPKTFSFPSGHALFALCFVGFLAGVIDLHLKRIWLRWMVWAGAFVLVALVGFSRMYLGVHYPSDVLAGYAAALAWMSTVGAVAHREARAEQLKTGG